MSSKPESTGGGEAGLNGMSVGYKSSSPKNGMVGLWDKPGIKKESSSGDMIGEWDKPGFVSETGNKGRIGEDHPPMKKSDKSATGKEGMIGVGDGLHYAPNSSLKDGAGMIGGIGQPEIFENPVESTLILGGQEERLSLLNKEEDRLAINAGAMNSVFSTDDEMRDGSQMIERGIQIESDQADSSNARPMFKDGLEVR